MMNNDPFSSFGNNSTGMNNSAHDAHAFATSMMTGFPIDGSHAAISGAMMHKDTMHKDTNSVFNDMNDGSFKSKTSFIKNIKYCKHCGTKINITANFCKNCGKEL